MGVPAWPWGSLQSSAWFCGNDADFSHGSSSPVTARVWDLGCPLFSMSPMWVTTSGTAWVPACVPLSDGISGGLDPLALPGITPGPQSHLAFRGASLLGIPMVGGCSPHEPSQCHIPVTNPVPLSPACLFRYNVLSLVYLLFLLLLPCFPGPCLHFTTGKGLTWGCRAGTAGVGSRGAATPLPQAPSLQFHPGWAAWLRVEPLSVNYSPAGLLIALLLQDGHFGALLTTNLRAQGWAVRAHHEQPLRPARGVAVAAGGHPHRGRWARGARSPPVPGSDPAPSTWHGHS